MCKAKVEVEDGFKWLVEELGKMDRVIVCRFLWLLDFEDEENRLNVRRDAELRNYSISTCLGISCDDALRHISQRLMKSARL
jgi:hypothetical protein